MKPYSRGKTLLELMVCTAILGLLLAMSQPALAPMLEEQRATAVANTLLANLQFARSNAILLKKAVSVCPSRDGKACSGDGSWAAGTIVSTSSSRKGEGPRPLRVLYMSDFKGLQLVSSRGSKPLIFRPDGSSTGTNQTLTLCSPDGRALRSVIVNNGGRSRIVKRPEAASCPGK